MNRETVVLILLKNLNIQ